MARQARIAFRWSTMRTALAALLVVSAGLVSLVSLGLAPDARTLVRSVAAVVPELSPQPGSLADARLDGNLDDHLAEGTGAQDGTTGEPPALRWTPAVGTRWHWVPRGAPDLAHPAQVYILELATTPASTVAAVHAAGAHAVCRIEVGVVEDDGARPAGLDPSALGRPVPGRPTARYVDLSRLDALRPYLSRRLDECWAKGFDGVDAAQVDTVTTAGPAAVGFPVTHAHEIDLARTVAAMAHSRGLAFGVHASDGDVARREFVAALEPVSDFAVVERCGATEPACQAFGAYSEHSKAVARLR